MSRMLDIEGLTNELEPRSRLQVRATDAAGNFVGTLNSNSTIRGAFQSASIARWVSQERNDEGCIRSGSRREADRI